MSLDQKLNDENNGFGSFIYRDITYVIDKLDAGYLRCATWLAETWQNKTYKSKLVLETALYTISFAGAGLYYANEPSPTAFAVAAINGFVAIASGVRNIKQEEKVIREFHDQVYADFPSFRILPTILNTLGIFNLGLGVSKFAYGYMNRDYHYYFEALSNLSFGIGATSLATGMYIARANTGDPPFKPKKKPLRERLKESIDKLLPKPVPQPAAQEIPL